MRAPLIVLRYRAAAAYLSASHVCPGTSPAEHGRRSFLPGTHCTASGKSAGTAALQPHRMPPDTKRPDRENTSHQSRESRWTRPWRRCRGRSCSYTPEAPGETRRTKTACPPRGHSSCRRRRAWKTRCLPGADCLGGWSKRTSHTAERGERRRRPSRFLIRRITRPPCVMSREKGSIRIRMLRIGAAHTVGITVGIADIIVGKKQDIPVACSSAMLRLTPTPRVSMVIIFTVCPSRVCTSFRKPSA